MVCGEKADTKQTAAQPEKPSDADLMAFKVYHHMMYMVITAKQAGCTILLQHSSMALFIASFSSSGYSSLITRCMPVWLDIRLLTGSDGSLHSSQ
jgi:hypothetical protein